MVQSGGRHPEDACYDSRVYQKGKAGLSTSTGEDVMVFVGLKS